MIHKELHHVNVVQMHHYFEDNLNVYMLLEACPRKVTYAPLLLLLPNASYYFLRPVLLIRAETFATRRLPLS